MIGDLLRLVRAPLVATAIADGAAGYLLATVRVATEVGGHAPALLRDAPEPRPLALVLVASTGLYWGGMALNDYFDIERDRRLYPFRPLPSGKVAPKLALAVGLALLALGVGAAWLGGGLLASGFALLVALSVLAYDGVLKRYRLPGALGMGLCRTGNIFMAAAAARFHAPLGVEGLAPFYALQAVAIGIYIFSVRGGGRPRDGRGPRVHRRPRRAGRPRDELPLDERDPVLLGPRRARGRPRRRGLPERHEGHGAHHDAVAAPWPSLAGRGLDRGGRLPPRARRLRGRAHRPQPLLRQAALQPWSPVGKAFDGTLM
jgi:hypothetical protein